MISLWTIASLTLKEAFRRKTYIATLLVAVIFICWSLLRMPFHPGMSSSPDAMSADQDPQAMADGVGKFFAWLGCGMIKFFSSVMAITLAAGAISTEIDKGVLSVIVPKPLSRVTIYLGKWLGLLIYLAASIALWAALLVFVVWHLTGSFHPRILVGVLATCLFPLLFTTLTLCFSTFASNALAAGLSLIAAGISLADDLLLSLSTMLQNDTLKTISSLVGYIVPIGKMNHWITRGLGTSGFDPTTLRNPLASAATSADLVYICVYIVAALGVGIWVFQKRDL